VVLQCTPGSQPAGLVLSAERPLPGSPALLQMQVRGAGLFQLHAVNADEAARQSGTMLGEIHPGDSRPLHRYPLPRTAPGAHAWSHWTIACPPSSAQLVLQNLQLQPAAAGPVPARSAWVWQPGAWRDTPDTVLARAQRHGIQTLFITVPLAAGAVQDPASLGRFIAQARAADVAVWAVDGDPRMVLPREHAIAAARARAFAQYNRQAAPQARLAGVQFDVEPYLLPGYDLATEQWERHYVALVAALQDAAGGLPLDMVVYEANRFQTDKILCIDENNPYFRMLRGSWGQKLREVFDSIEQPVWNGGHTEVPLVVQSARAQTLKKITSPQERLI